MSDRSPSDRRSTTLSGVALAGRPHIAPYRLAVVDMGAPTIDLTKALALADALEDSELVRKMDARR